MCERSLTLCDVVVMRVQVNWSGKWYSLNLRQVTICHISDDGLGVITRHEDLWSWSPTLSLTTGAPRHHATPHSLDCFFSSSLTAGPMCGCRCR